MKTYAYSEARKELNEIINQVVYQKERFFLERRGRKVTAIVPIEDIELLEKSIANRI